MAKATFMISDNYCGQCEPQNLVEQNDDGIVNPFGSFATEHENVDAKFLVDGKETFAEMATAIENAKTDVSLYELMFIMRVINNQNRFTCLFG